MLPKLAVLMSPEVLKQCQASGYNLSIIRNVKDGLEDKKGNMVFCQVLSDSLTTDTHLSWAEKFQVYETAQIHLPGTGLPLGLRTSICPIAGGQTVTFKWDSGHEGPEGAIKQDLPFKVINNWIRSSVVVEIYDELAERYAPMYSSTPNNPDLTSTLTPIKKVGIFWTKEFIQTDDIIDPDKTETPIYFLDFTDRPRATIRYDGKDWRDLPPPPVVLP